MIRRPVGKSNTSVSRLYAGTSGCMVGLGGRVSAASAMVPPRRRLETARTEAARIGFDCSNGGTGPRSNTSAPPRRPSGAVCQRDVHAGAMFPGMDVLLVGGLGAAAAVTALVAWLLLA